jgi:N-methylhydantoinase A
MGRLATDVGGTFTDLVYFDEATNALSVAKTLTTPKDPTIGIVQAIELSGLDPGGVDYFVHGGTTVINAITERKGVKTALITTSGFRDVLEIGRGNRPDLYNLHFLPPRAFVPRYLRFEVRERLDHEGRVLQDLHLEDLDVIIEACRREQVQAIAIQFLHSYAEPRHETACVHYLRARLPGIAITASHQITREWREYERVNTTVLNAYVQPIIQSYFDTLERSLRHRGLRCPLFAMQSNGGTTSFGWAREHPITLLESGPAAGVNGAALIGALCGEENVISLDIGGTTAKCSLIESGSPKVTTEYRLERSRTYPGYPVKVPLIDIVEIGAGGGSIAWFNDVGVLNVGPISAGADPGPACYAQGGTEPTVTDAKLVTGVLNPENFAAGRMRLDVELARRAMQQIGDTLGQSIEQAALSIIRLVEANMINALKLVSIQRGYDPREFVLVASGGGGPMHAAILGRELGVKAVIVPRFPGLFSAWGMLATAPRRDFVRTALHRAETIDIAAVRAIFASMLAEANAYFGAEQSSGTGRIRTDYRIDLRYHGQEHSVSVPVDLATATIEGILQTFHEVHERTYTFRLPDTPVELVHFRLTAEADAPRPRLTPVAGKEQMADQALKGRRLVIDADHGVCDMPVYERELLPGGFTTIGPAIVEEASSVTLVLPGQWLSVDALGMLHITEAP